LTTAHRSCSCCLSFPSMPSLSELKEGVDELRQIVAKAQSVELRTLLERELKVLEERYARDSSLIGEGSAISKDGREEHHQSEQAKTSREGREGYNYAVVQKYAWTQTKSKVKVYIPISNVGKTAKEGSIDVHFTPTSYYVFVHDIEGKSYRAGIAMLGGQIDPSSSSHRLKDDDVVITLAKAKSGEWGDLKAKSTYIQQQRAERSGAADGNLMNVLKDMYADGDEETRKVIEDSWKERIVDKGLDKDLRY